MTFQYIEEETECECLNDFFEDFSNIYARKVSKSATPKERDFKSHWERGKRPKNIEDCKTVCSYMALSVHPWNDQTKEIVQNHYIQSCKITPGYKKRICVFNLAPNGGKFKHTPEPNDETHHDFIKSDQFEIQSILLQEMIPIN